MVDYQEMYYKLNRAMEKAINILVAAQRECEEDYLQLPPFSQMRLDMPGARGGKASAGGQEMAGGERGYGQEQNMVV